ncbi:type II secretion system protein [Glaciimonas immobilis]|uniref:MSHA biogenesis protein MshO n=1 Tax=Glaciimonas immobilis TaxID=728004 RepID=A0A840RPG6_9BURK|nr:type II secretion system protein [Glaciimonas immobilis]KAF3998983.1 type II secretion system protein [Glaciimonas immobilis]MBB5198399.1 MSHA biogenesis protein MshO [Glaciimonas immobilis]
MRPAPIKRCRGFTLIEAVTVIAITGVIAAVVVGFIRSPVQGYFDLERRVETTDTADTALRRMGRDFRLALPNSVRSVGTSPLCLEYLPTVTGGRYRAEAPGAALDFTTPTTTFDVLSTLNPIPASGDQVVVYNLGIPGADAYSGENRATILSATANSITLDTATQFSLASPGNRFQILPAAEQAVFYVCTNSGSGIDAAGNGNGSLYRLSHYGINAVAPTSCPAVSTDSPMLAQNVSHCEFDYTAGVTQRNGLISMRIDITKDHETTSLYNAVHVSNSP